LTLDLSQEKNSKFDLDNHNLESKIKINNLLLEHDKLTKEKLNTNRELTF
jgi:hypothetical protein